MIPLRTPMAAAGVDRSALVALVRFTPLLFTLFMFFGELLFAVALLLLAGAILADLRARDLLFGGPDRPGTPS